MGTVQKDGRQVGTRTGTANTRHIPQGTRRCGGKATPTHPAHVLHKHTNGQNGRPHASHETDQRPDGNTTTAGHTHAHLCQIRRQWYEQAKYTGIWYADAKLLLLICGRYRRLCAGTEKLLDLHLRQALYLWRQQKHLANMTQCYHDACKHKTTQYWQTTRPARQAIYLIRKRPREHWDPTLWEVSMQPLPKRHKKHWDPNEWEIPMT